MEKKITYPLRVGRKQNRVVLDAAGLEIVTVSPAFPELAHEFVGYMNAKAEGITNGGDQQCQQCKFQYSGFKKTQTETGNQKLEIETLKKRVSLLKEEIKYERYQKERAFSENEIIVKDREALKVENGELMEMYNMASLKNEELIRKNKELTEARDYLAKEVQEANATLKERDSALMEADKNIEALRDHVVYGKPVHPDLLKESIIRYSPKPISPPEFPELRTDTFPGSNDLSEIIRKYNYRIKALEAIVGITLTIGVFNFLFWVSKTFS